MIETNWASLLYLQGTADYPIRVFDQSEPAVQLFLISVTHIALLTGIFNLLS